MHAASLRERVLRAGGWSIAGYALSQVIRFGSSLLMTRLLVPEMFGVMAIGSIVMAGLAMFSDIGLRQGIVQSARGNQAEYLNTAWVIQIVRGVLMFACALAVSGLLVFANALGAVPSDNVYAAPVLPWVIAALSLGAVIGGFESTKASEASRHLSLGRITQIELLSQILGVLCMVAWAALDRSIWALVSGSIVATLVRTVLTHTWLPGSANRWQWDRQAAREIISFGKWIFASSILGFLVNSGDRLLLGGLVDTTMLGVYVIAVLVASSVEQVLAKVVGDVAFPALSETVRDRRADLKSNYYRFHIVIAGATYLCVGLLMVSGEALIALLYDARYAGAGPMLEILAVGLVSVPFRVAGYCLVALGLPRLMSQIIAFRLLVMVVAMPLGFHLFGVEGALWGLVLSHGAYVLLTVVYKVRFDLFELRWELAVLPLVLLGALCAYPFRWLLGD